MIDICPALLCKVTVVFSDKTLVIESSVLPVLCPFVGLNQTCYHFQSPIRPYNHF